MQVEYVQHWGNDLIVVNAARVSFDKESSWEVVGYEHEYDPDSRTEITHPIYALSEKDAKLINFLAREGHTSCFEHMGATLRLKVPIFIARQIQRHRTFSYNEISRRYVDTEPEFYWPDKWRKRADNVKQGSTEEASEYMHDPKYGNELWETHDEYVRDEVLGQVVNMYNGMIENDVAPELARMILPQNMYTEFYMSGNLRAWAHFLHLRLDQHAQKEVRDVAEKVEDILMPLFTVSMEALREHG